MTRHEQDLQSLQRACCGNADAMDFLNRWRAYVHAIDDLVDGDLAGHEALLSTFAQAIPLYSHPFYLNHLRELRQIALNCTNAYADVVAWEKSGQPWQAQFADHYRHFGAEMVLAVAMICGGYEHARSFSLELRTICWLEHHDAAGKAV
jgi:hypothetical protein